jgi:hypothetical protein
VPLLIIPFGAWKQIETKEIYQLIREQYDGLEFDSTVPEGYRSNAAGAGKKVDNA